MSKRFIDTDLIRKVWFRDLTPVQKCLFIYLFTACDVAGVIEKDLSGMSFSIGQKVTDKDLAALGSQVVELANGKLYLPDYVSFQYGELSPSCKPHIAIINLLKKHDLTTINKRLPKGIVTLKEKEEDKDKETDKDKDKDQDGGCKGVAATSTRPRNELLDALAECDGDPLQIPASAWGRIAKALAEIKAVCQDVTPEEIRRRSANYRTHFGANISLTSTALVKHWAKCDTQKTSSFATGNTDVRGNPLHPDAIRAKTRFAGGEMIEVDGVSELFDKQEVTQ